MAQDNEGAGFGDGMRYWNDWLQSMAPAGDGAAGAGFPWREGIEQWTRLVSGQAAPQVQELGARFQFQAGDWLGAMQQVAARFAGRDTSAAEVAAAWREAVQGQGDALLGWMLDAARGGNASADQPELREFLRGFAPGFPGMGDAAWLNAPAFGPAREHQARWQELLRFQRAHQQQMEAYVEAIRGVLDDAFERFEAKLGEHEAPGTQLTSARAMFDLWIDAAEEAYAAMAMSEEFQALYAELANSQMRLRAATRQELERASEAMGVPTRTEMDAAHRRIAELERQLRRMATAAAQAPSTVAPQPAAGSKKAATARPEAVKPKAAKPAKAAKKAVGKASKPATKKVAKNAAKKVSAKTAKPAPRKATGKTAPRRGGKP